MQGQGLDPVILADPFQNGLFCDSMIFSQQWCPVCKSVGKGCSPSLSACSSHLPLLYLPHHQVSTLGWEPWMSAPLCQ